MMGALSHNQDSNSSASERPSSPVLLPLINKKKLFKFHEAVAVDRCLFALKPRNDLFLELESISGIVRRHAKNPKSPPSMSRLCFSLEEKFCVESPFVTRFNENIGSYVNNKKRIDAIRKSIVKNVLHQNLLNVMPSFDQTVLPKQPHRKRKSMCSNNTDKMNELKAKHNKLPPIQTVGRACPKRLVLVQSTPKVSSMQLKAGNPSLELTQTEMKTWNPNSCSIHDVDDDDGDKL